MRLKIYDGTHEPGVVSLRLYEAEPDHIALEGVHETGESAFLLTVTKAGRIALACDVFPELGFDLGRDGRVLLDAYCEAQTAQRARRSGPRAVLVKG